MCIHIHRKTERVTIKFKTILTQGQKILKTHTNTHRVKK